MLSHNQHEARILVVDDEPRMCDSLKWLLNSHKFNVSTALTGSEALKWISSETFDVTVLDLVLTDIDGMELMKKIRRVCPETCVVIITGSATLDPALSPKKNDVFDYLQKPFDYPQLLETIKNALKQKNQCSKNTKIKENPSVSDEKYRFLVKNSPDIIYILNEEGCFEYVSDSVQSLLGYKPGSLIGQHFSKFIAEQDGDACKWFFQERPADEHASSGAEVRLKVLGDGSGWRHCEILHLPVDLKAAGIYGPLTEKGRSFFGIHGVARDVTIRKRMENQVQQMERMKSIGILAGGIAHNFNNILMGVQGCVSLMMLGKNSSNPDYEHLRNIETYVKKAVELTRELLGFARGGKYEVKPTDLNALIQNENRMFSLTRKKIRVHAKFQKKLWTVNVDRNQMQHALMNLYMNAYQAMPGGGNLYTQTENVIIDKDYIKPFAVTPGRYVKISITDSGSGMDAATRERIFDPFFSTRNVSQGSGLGLASVYGIIKNHGGFINVYSEKGQGTTFNMYLPAAQKVLVKEETEPDFHKIEYGHGTVLLVDDEEMIINVGQTMLNRLGYRVLTARSGKEAIGLYSKNGKKVDIVILDMIMSGMGGGETYDQLKEINKNVRVLLSSGYSINGQAQEILDRGCKGFIQKPFSIVTLSRALKEALSN